MDRRNVKTRVICVYDTDMMAETVGVSGAVSTPEMSQRTYGFSRLAVSIAAEPITLAEIVACCQTRNAASG